MKLIPDVFLVTTDWWSEITTSVIKWGWLKSLYKIVQQPRELLKLLQVKINLYSKADLHDNMGMMKNKNIMIFYIYYILIKMFLFLVMDLLLLHFCFEELSLFIFTSRRCILLWKLAGTRVTK